MYLQYLKSIRGEDFHDDSNAMEMKCLVRPKFEFREHECSIARMTGEEVKDEEHDDDHPELHDQILEEKQEDNFDMFVSSLKLKIPSVGELRVQQDDDGDDGSDGLKTPTSLDHKITATLQCPPAPKKPKSLPLKKRKANRTRLLLHLPTEIESLFPPVVVSDLGGKILKKVRRPSDVHTCTAAPHDHNNSRT